MPDDLTPTPGPATRSADEPVTLEAERVPRRGIDMRGRGFASAWAIAIAADLLQIVLFPFFVAGAASPWSDALDFVVAFLLIRRLGWHWAFLPTIVGELIPFVDLVPSWTIAVFLATRKGPPQTTRDRTPTER